MNKIKELKKNHEKECDKYFKAMSYRVMAVEIDALYNVLILDKESEYELTRRYEENVREILSR